jgi:flagellar assembly protein FliH
MMSNTSDSAVFGQPTQKSNSSVFSDLYEEHKSKVNANAPQQVSPEQLKMIYAKAYQKGYLKGEREAKENVMTVVHEELAELKQSMHQLATSEEMLSLALEISKTMVKAEILVNHEVVLPVIRQALTRLPSVQVPIRLMVHPEDEVLVTRYMKESFEGVCQVIADRGVERGGCFLESETNLIDATNATRWGLICQGLGCSDQWLAGASNAD